MFSRSAFEITVEIVEAQALADWHRSNMHESADKLDYADAESSKRRADELDALVQKRISECKAEICKDSSSVMGRVD